MALERRDFLKLASCAGLSVVAPHAWGGKDLSYGRKGIAVDAYTGTFFLLFHASGGWDPTHLCDPKPASGPNDPQPTTHLQPGDIAQNGNIRYPGSFPAEFYDPNMMGGPGSAITSFFETYGNRMTCINGLDMQTNGHDSGTQSMWTGSLVPGLPSLGAYLAGTFNSALPMAFLAFGGFTETAGVAPRTRAGNLDALARIAYPTRSDPTNEESTYHSSRALELIDEAQWHRDQAIISGQGLPKIRGMASTLFESRSGSNELQRLQEYLPPQDVLQALTGLQQQVVVAIAAYRAGISIAANLSVGGFDTHGDHDASQIPALDEIVGGAAYAMEEAGRHGLQDKIVIIMGSDFGRTPGYNDGNGKDHWNTTSMIFMGQGIAGNRVVGETSENHEAYGVFPDLSIDRNIEAPLKILTAHVHSAIRDKYALGADNPLAQLAPLATEEKLPLL
jgi:hypothetical protein